MNTSTTNNNKQRGVLGFGVYGRPAGSSLYYQKPNSEVIMNDQPKRWSELDNKQKQLVERYIETLLHEQTTFDEVIEKPGREVVQRRITGGFCLQLEKVKCGKRGCKCSSGELHGPYWYAYWRVGGRLKSKYVGKKLPGSYVTGDTNSIEGVT